jgi:hypothetical protein
MSDDVTDAIEAAAKNPQRVRTDAGEVEAHPLPDQIEADKYLKAKAAAGTKSRGLRFNQIVPGGFH